MKLKLAGALPKFIKLFNKKYKPVSNFESSYWITDLKFMLIRMTATKQI
jgi:hypothetical protein